MTTPNLVKRPFFILALLGLAICASAQTRPVPIAEKNNSAKPYKLLTQGKQITIRSAQALDAVMVWTSGGHRVLEERSIDKNEFQVNLTVPSRVYFIMIRLKNGKTYSEKIGSGI